MTGRNDKSARLESERSLAAQALRNQARNEAEKERADAEHETGDRP